MIPTTVKNREKHSEKQRKTQWKTTKSRLIQQDSESHFSVWNRHVVHTEKWNSTYCQIQQKFDCIYNILISSELFLQNFFFYKTIFFPYIFFIFLQFFFLSKNFFFSYIIFVLQTSFPVTFYQCFYLIRCWFQYIISYLNEIC